MPQFEIRETDGAELITRIRARSAETAVREHFRLDEEVAVSVESGIEFGALSGWHGIEGVLKEELASEIELYPCR